MGPGSTWPEGFATGSPDAEAGLKDGRPLDSIQLGKLDIEVLGAPGERPRLIHSLTAGRTVSVARVQSIHHVHPLDDLTDGGEPVVQAGVGLVVDEHLRRPAVGSGPGEGHAPPRVRLGDGIVEEQLLLPDDVHVGIVVDTPSGCEVRQHPVESDSIIPSALDEVVEAVGPEGGPIAVHLDDEHPRRGF